MTPKRPNSWLWLLLWREWQHHPWRHGVALLAVALGVALAFSVHLINSSALTQFGDGMTLSQYDGLVAALPPAMRKLARLMPSVLSIGSPRKAKKMRIDHATAAERIAIRRR